MAVFQFIAEDQNVQTMMMRLDTALNPGAIAGFLTESTDPYLRGRAKARFDNEGDDVVGQWLPLSPDTEDIRQNMGYSPAHPINVRSGALERYIVDSPNSMFVDPANGATLTLPGNEPTGSLLTKVTTAQQGKDYPETLPRPVLGMNEKDLTYILATLSGFFVKSMML